MTYLRTSPVNKSLEKSLALKLALNRRGVRPYWASCCSYLSLSWISSTALFCPLGAFACCCPDICEPKSPLLLAALNASSVFALAGHRGGFSPWSCHLLPLACLTLAPPPMVVLLRRAAGPLIPALSLISAAPLTHFYLTFRALRFKVLHRCCALPFVASAGGERAARLSRRSS